MPCVCYHKVAQLVQSHLRCFSFKDILRVYQDVCIHIDAQVYMCVLLQFSYWQCVKTVEKKKGSHESLGWQKGENKRSEEFSHISFEPWCRSFFRSLGQNCKLKKVTSGCGLWACVDMRREVIFSVPPSKWRIRFPTESLKVWRRVWEAKRKSHTDWRKISGNDLNIWSSKLGISIQHSKVAILAI